jgi:hypothetical protein
MNQIFVFLFFVSLLLLPVLIIKPSLLNKSKLGPTSRKRTLLIFGGITLLLLVVSISTATPRKGYKILSTEKLNTVENIDVLITDTNSDPKKIAEEVKTTCSKPCNISVYDDKKAFELQDQYDQMMKLSTTEIGDLDEWKAKNYIYVADHLVGYMEFSEGYYNDYPYKDSYYEELKN